LTSVQEVIADLGVVRLPGLLGLPERAKGLVLFAHGSGSSRLSPRNNMVAAVLRKAGLGTFLFDLLTPNEDLDPRSRFDVKLLARRLIAATNWAANRVPGLPLGYFGASTGAAAAILAAATSPAKIGAIVSRGGRVDLARDVLHLISVPTLLIVGELDEPVLSINSSALELLKGPKRLAVVRGASHLFEEPGALEEVARLSAEWFSAYLTAQATNAPAPPSCP
jgi:putative phosphoribosyl transferase